MTTIATLLVELIADARQYQETLKETKQETSSWRDSLRGFADDATQGLSSIGSSLITGGLVVASTAALGLGMVMHGVWEEGKQWETQQAQLNAVLASTHGIAGVTANQVNNLADALSHETMFQDDAIMGAENMLLTFTNIGSNVFPQATETVLDMAQALGEDTTSAAMQLGKALNDPILGVTALRRVGVNLTDGQKDLIEELVKSGDVLSAQKIILRELQTEFGGSAKAAGETLPGQLAIMQQSFRDMEQNLYQELMPVLTQVTKIFNEEMAKPETKQFLEDVTNGFVWLARQLAAHLPDIIQGLKNTFGWLMDNKGIIIGAVAAIGTAIGVAAWTALAPLIPALLVMVAIGAVAYLLYQAWVSDFGGIQEKMAAFWAFIQPILQGVWDWLQTQWPIAVQVATDFWNKVLIPALKDAWLWIQENLIPVLKNILQTLKDHGLTIDNVIATWDKIKQAWGDIVKGGQGLLNFFNQHMKVDMGGFGEWLSKNLAPAFTWLGEFWTNTLLPAMQAAWQWMNTVLFPFFGALINLLFAKTHVWELLGAVWQTLYPIIKPVADLIGGYVTWAFGNLMAIVKTLGEWIMAYVVWAFGNLTTILKTLTDGMNGLADSMNNLSLPDWLTPGSPTPFELGLRGIHDAMSELNSSTLPEFKSQMTMTGVNNPAAGVPSSATGSAQGNNEMLMLLRQLLTRSPIDEKKLALAIRDSWLQTTS